MIPAPAVPGGSFRKCCLTSGRHDGAERKDYFQGVRRPRLDLESRPPISARMGFDWKRAAGLPPMDAAYGVVPARREVERLRTYTLIEPCGIHLNPRFYKYRWRIWARDNTDRDWLPELDDRVVQGHPLRRIPQPVAWLSFCDAIRRMQALVAQQSYFYALTDRMKRSDPAAPWRPDVCNAPAYDADQDAPFHGHK